MLALNHGIRRLLAHIFFTSIGMFKILHIVPKKSKYFRQSNFCNCSLVGAACLLFSFSLSLWAVVSLVNPWRAALHSPRSTLDYYARGTTMFARSNGRETQKLKNNSSLQSSRHQNKEKQQVQLIILLMNQTLQTKCIKRYLNKHTYSVFVFITIIVFSSQQAATSDPSTDLFLPFNL